MEQSCISRENPKNRQSVGSAIQSDVGELARIQDELKNGSYYFDDHFVVQFKDVVLKCFWQNREFSCNDAFVNHLCDHGVCFSFNVGNTRASLFLNTTSGKNVHIFIHV